MGTLSPTISALTREAHYPTLLIPRCHPLAITLVQTCPRYSASADSVGAIAMKISYCRSLNHYIVSELGEIIAHCHSLEDALRVAGIEPEQESGEEEDEA